MATVGTILGGIVGVFLLSRIVWWMARRWPNTARKAVLLDTLSYVVVIVVASFGMSLDGSPAVALAAQTYVLPYLVVLVLDLLRIRGGAKSTGF